MSVGLECWRGGGRPTPNTLLICCGVADSRPALTRRAVIGSGGFSRSPAGRAAIIAAETLSLCQYIDSASVSPHSVNSSFFRCGSSSPPESSGGMYISKWSAPLFLTYSTPSVSPLPAFIHQCPLAPPSVCLPFYSAPRIIPSPHPLPRYWPPSF